MMPVILGQESIVTPWMSRKDSAARGAARPAGRWCRRQHSAGLTCPPEASFPALGSAGGAAPFGTIRMAFSLYVSAVGEFAMLGA